MLKKIFSIIENIIIIVLAFFGGKYCYNNLIIVHANSCCRHSMNCPIYACEVDSPGFYKYYFLAAGAVFCAALIIFLIINTIKVLFKRT
jgi:hypothetical protein